MNMNTLITNFENKVNALVIAENGVELAENEVELAIIDIVSLLQKGRGRAGLLVFPMSPCTELSCGRKDPPNPRRTITTQRIKHLFRQKL